MKTVLALLVVAAVGIQSAPQSAPSAAGSITTIAEATNALFSAFKHVIPCGDPATNLPILEPLRVPIVSLDINRELLVLKGSIENVVLSGIGDFIVIDLKSNATNNRTTYDILFRDVQLLGEYNLYINADLAGYKLVLNLMGLMNLQVKDLRLNGGFNVGTNEIGGMLFSDVVTYVNIGGVVSDILDPQFSVALGDFFNKFVAEASMVYVKTRREFLNELISTYTTQTANAMVHNVTLSNYVQELVDLSETWNAVPCSA